MSVALALWRSPSDRRCVIEGLPPSIRDALLRDLSEVTRDRRLLVREVLAWRHCACLCQQFTPSAELIAAQKCIDATGMLREDI